MTIKIEKATHSDRLEPNSKQKESGHDPHKMKKNHPKQDIEEVENLMSDKVEVQSKLLSQHFIYWNIARDEL